MIPSACFLKTQNSFLKAHRDFRRLLVDPGQGRVHGLFVLGHVVGDLFPVRQKDDPVIQKRRFPAAHAPPHLLHPDEGPLHPAVGHGLDAKAVPVIDGQIAHPQPVKDFRLFVVCAQGGKILSLDGAGEFLLCHSDTSRFLFYLLQS